MVTILDDTSRTFSEYLLIPRLTEKGRRADLVTLATPISSAEKDVAPRLKINVPVVSACMQAVSGVHLSIAVARQGGLGFIFCSQPIARQVDMVRQVKAHKAGFVQSDANITTSATLTEVSALMQTTGHSTVPVTDDGTASGVLVGIITSKDYWEFEDDLQRTVGQHMTPFAEIIHGKDGISLREANEQLHRHKKDCLPIVDAAGRLSALVFKKDYVDHRLNPLELLDDSKRFRVGAAINTHDYEERVPALLAAGADALCFDASDGFSEYQLDGIRWIREKHGQDIVIGGGNVVSAEGFDYLVEAGGVDFIKVGMGGGSICITREQKGVGRGQASALLEVARRRDEYWQQTGRYIPICSDGGLANDTQIVIALAMGADFVMMGRYFAMTEESPTPRTSINGQLYKPYWGEGTLRAQNWQRYGDDMRSRKMVFEEGVDAYVPLVGPLAEVLQITLYKLRSTMLNIGADNLQEFRRRAILTLVSAQSVVEGGTSNVFQFNTNRVRHETQSGGK